MRRFCAILVVCFGVLTSFCAAAIVVGRNQPEGAFIQQLQRCGDALCYLGIMPGATPWDESLAAIRQAPQLTITHNPELSFQSADPRYEVFVFPLTRNGDDQRSWILNEISMNLADDTLSIGEMIVKLGEPCYVVPNGGAVFLGWPDAVSVVEQVTPSMTASSPVTHIMMRRQTFPCYKGVPPSVPGVFGWRGFRRYP